MIRAILIGIVILALVGVSMFVFMHARLMPTRTELARIDELVREQAAPVENLQRLRAPDEIEYSGTDKRGYFTYLLTTKNQTRKVRADWRIEGGRVEIISVKDL